MDFANTLRVCAATFVMLAVSACTGAQHSRPLKPLATVAEVDLTRYLGTWYEIARLPHRFQKSCLASEATYSLRPDGDINVLNACHKGSLDGPLSVAHGHARRNSNAPPGQLEVSFFWPIWAHYWILELAPDYSYAVVGHPTRKYLWILSRKRQMEPATYAAIVERMRSLGFDTTQLIKTVQPADRVTENTH